MADRYDLKVARTDRNGKTWWTRIGVMFPMKERDGFNLQLEALPIPSLNDKGELEVRVTAWEPFKEDGNKGNGSSQAEQPGPTGAPEVPEATGETLDDEIPF
jgi:hypothetical protein